MISPPPDLQTRALLGTVSVHDTAVRLASTYGASCFLGVIFEAPTTLTGVTPVDGYSIVGFAGHTYPAGYYPWQFTSLQLATGAATLVLGS